MSSTDGITTVITTFNRKEMVRKLLKQLGEQTLPSDCFEVIVADDGSTDGTAEMVQEADARVPYRLRYLRHENQGPGAAQNMGIRAAEYDLVLLIADDIMPTPPMLQEHLESHQAYPEDYFAVLGKATQSPELPTTALHKVWDPFQYDRFEGKKELDGIYFMGCNVSVKKSFLLNNGMYLERKAAAHEDIELGYRLMQKGLRIIYNPAAFAHHEHEESLDRICTRAYERGYNFDLLADNIPAEYIYPLYKILSLDAGIWSCLKMLPRELPRWVLFNGPAVKIFWLPVLRRADSSSLAALFACQASYRGVSGYYLRKGLHDKRRQKVLPPKAECVT